MISSTTAESVRRSFLHFELQSLLALLNQILQMLDSCSCIVASFCFDGFQHIPNTRFSRDAMDVLRCCTQVSKLVDRKYTDLARRRCMRSLP
jgi:hypothetical protein